MKEARRVLERLRRIELLDREGARPEHLLAEVRALLEEAEAWVGAERGETGAAGEALERCRRELEARNEAERRAPLSATTM